VGESGAGAVPEQRVRVRGLSSRGVAATRSGARLLERRTRSAARRGYRASAK